MAEWRICPVYVAQASRCGNAGSPELRAVQRALVDPDKEILAGPNTDEIGPSCHMTDATLTKLDRTCSPRCGSKFSMKIDRTGAAFAPKKRSRSGPLKRFLPGPTASTPEGWPIQRSAWPARLVRWPTVRRSTREGKPEEGHLEKLWRRRYSVLWFDLTGLQECAAHSKLASTASGRHFRISHRSRERGYRDRFLLQQHRHAQVNGRGQHRTTDTMIGSGRYNSPPDRTQQSYA